MKPRVLIADSNVKSLGLYKRIFPSIGIDIEVAEDGLDCLHKLHDFLPELVILELELLWGGGDGVIALMGEDVSTSPVVLVTEHAQPELLARKLGYPVVDCLRKPFAPNVLVAKIQSTLAIRRNRHHAVKVSSAHAD